MDIIFNIGEKKGEFDSFIPLLSSFIGSFISAMAVFYTVNRTNKKKLKELLVQTISEERIRWINTLRDEFVEFNKNIVVYKAIIDENEGDISSEENRKFEEVIASIHRITLLLNPSEHYMQYLIAEINGLSQASSTIREEYDPQPFLDAKWRISHYSVTPKFIDRLHPYGLHPKPQKHKQTFTLRFSLVTNLRNP